VPTDRLTPRQREILGLVAAGRCHWTRYQDAPAPTLIRTATDWAVHATPVRRLRALSLIAAPGPLAPYERMPAALTDAGRRAHEEATRAH
jgi:hypothetical protein